MATREPANEGNGRSSFPTLKGESLDFRDKDPRDEDSAERWRWPLYWLAGARWETLRVVDSSERERIAIIGSSVLIPSLMGLVAMYLFLRSRYESSTGLPWVAGAIVWAFVVLNVDRIVVATYRPLASLFRKSIQVGVRVLLAAVISIAIGFPFCLDLFRSTIRHYYDARLERIVADLKEKDRSAREKAQQEFRAADEPLDEELRKLEQANPVGLTPEEFADARIRQQQAQVGTEGFTAPSSRETVQALSDIEAAKQALDLAETSAKDATARRIARESDLANELEGQENRLYGTKSRPGVGPRYRQIDQLLSGDRASELELLAKVDEQRSRLGLLQEQLVELRRQDDEAFVRGSEAARAVTIEKATLEQNATAEKMTKIRERRKELGTERDQELAKIDAAYAPLIAVYERKRAGQLDPLEETIGLYRAIFESSSDDITATAVQTEADGARAKAGLLQFGVVFFALFLIDLIPIIAKVFSPPGPYDALVASREEVAAANFKALKLYYPQVARSWFESRSRALDGGGSDEGISVADPHKLAALILTLHRGAPIDSPISVYDWAERDAQPPDYEAREQAHEEQRAGAGEDER